MQTKRAPERGPFFSVICQFIYFPMGVGLFVKGIAKIAGVSLEEAEDQRRQYLQGITDPARREKLTQFLSGESEEWKKKFLETRESFYHIGLLPEDVVLFGGGAEMPEIRTILRDPEWMKGPRFSGAIRSPAPWGARLMLGSERSCITR